MNTEMKNQLNELGDCILWGRSSLDQVARFINRLEVLWEAKGDRAGKENYFEHGIRRPANLAGKDDLFCQAYADPEYAAALPLDIRTLLVLDDE